MAIEMMVSKITGKVTGYRAVVRQFGRKINSRVFQNKRDALREEAIMKSEITKGRNILPQYTPLPLEKAFDMWFKEQIEACGGHKYKILVQSYFKNHIQPFFCKRDVRSINAENIFLFRQNLLSKGLSRITVKNILGALKRMFTHLIEEERLLVNPVKKKHMVTQWVSEKRVWTVNECKAFLEFADRKYTHEKRGIYFIYKIAANCGLRWGEIAALHVDDLDFFNSRIRINKGYCQVGKCIKLPKSGRIRYAALPSALADELRDYIQENNVNGILFKNREGGYFSYNTFRNDYWLKDTKYAEVPYVRFHSLRRLYCTTFIENGGNEVALRKLVGHQDKRMTDLYTTMREDFGGLAKIVNL